MSRASIGPGFCVLPRWPTPYHRTSQKLERLACVMYHVWCGVMCGVLCSGVCVGVGVEHGGVSACVIVFAVPQCCACAVGRSVCVAHHHRHSTSHHINQPTTPPPSTRSPTRPPPSLPPPRPTVSSPPPTPPPRPLAPSPLFSLPHTHSTPLTTSTTHPAPLAHRTLPIHTKNIEW